MNSAFQFLATKVLPFIGKLGKGKATIAGAAAVVASQVANVVAPHVLTDQNLVAALHELANILTALGTVISAFGFGRKAGVAAQ